MNREKAIDWLLVSDTDDWNSEADLKEYFKMILYDGFKGYRHYTDQALINELADRDMLDIFMEYGWITKEEAV